MLLSYARRTGLSKKKLTGMDSDCQDKQVSAAKGR
jgi:hypothetical protein